MKTKKPFLNLDERNKLIAYKVIVAMYFLTIFTIQSIVIYRQMVLGESTYDFEALAIIMSVNSIFMITGLLYFGAIPLQKLRIKTMTCPVLAYI